jgi:hypothetical protein
MEEGKEAWMKGAVYERYYAGSKGGMEEREAR